MAAEQDKVVTAQPEEEDQKTVSMVIETKEPGKKRKRQKSATAAPTPPPPTTTAPATKKSIGSRHDVYYGKAVHTAGGLGKDDLCLNSRGRVVSKKMSERAKARYPGIKEKLRRKKPVVKKEAE